ncbi:MAG: cytochrome P460 family protein [Armatimonas sp.]
MRVQVGMKPALLTLSPLALLACAALALSAPPPPQLAGFRKWHRATEAPYRQVRLISAMCAAPVPIGASKGSKLVFTNPHLNYDVHVFVNAARQDSMKLDGPKFPEGSVVVKEKYEAPNSDKSSPRAVLLTVMRKREAGYDSKNGDWEYFTGDPQTLRLKKVAGKALKTCQDCHANYSKQDFITKTYLAQPPLKN